MERKKKNVKIDNSGLRKLRACMATGFVILILLIIRIGYLQFVQGAELKEAATKNQLSSKTIAASRGTIYDSTGKALAISANVDTVSINPSQVKYSNGEEVNKEVLAHAFSDIFGLDYEETLEKLNTEEKSFVIASKVENDKITALEDWMENNKVKSGISVTDDIKRYYPYNNLASNLIGFTGAENTGRMGLEYSLDDILSRNTWKNFNCNRFY